MGTDCSAQRFSPKAAMLKSAIGLKRGDKCCLHIMTFIEIIIIYYDIIQKMIKHEHDGTYTLLHVYSITCMVLTCILY